MFPFYHECTMHCSDNLHNASARRTSILLLVVLTLVQRLWAAPPGGYSNCNSWWNWADGTGNAPGVGYEFETRDFRFTNPLCTTLQETNDLKWKRITQIGRDRIGGRLWELTVDTSLLMPGVLVAEVILDGTRLRVGYPDAANTANEAAFAIVQSRDDSIWHNLN